MNGAEGDIIDTLSAAREDSADVVKQRKAHFGTTGW
jgi:hypothetical protein